MHGGIPFAMLIRQPASACMGTFVARAHLDAATGSFHTF